MAAEIVLLPCYSLEDFSLFRSSEESDQILSAWSALYHPALLEKSGRLPHWEPSGNPIHGQVYSLVIIPPCCESNVPHEWLEKVQESDAILIRGLSSRPEILNEALKRLGLSSDFDEEFVDSFLSLGFCHFMTELLTRKLRYMSNLDTQNFENRIFDALKAYREQADESNVDPSKAVPPTQKTATTATQAASQNATASKTVRQTPSEKQAPLTSKNASLDTKNTYFVHRPVRENQLPLSKQEESLQGAYDLLCQAKEYFFPTAVKLLDLTWLEEEDLGQPLWDMLKKRQQRRELTNLVLSVEQLICLKNRSPKTLDLLREEIKCQRVCLVGGDAPLDVSALGAEEIALSVNKSGINAPETDKSGMNEIGTAPIADVASVSTNDENETQEPRQLIAKDCQAFPESGSTIHGMGQPLYLLSSKAVVDRILKGRQIYRQLLDAEPMTFGRYEAGYGPNLPQLLKKSGYKMALGFTRDGWALNGDRQSVVRWRGADGTIFPILVKKPINAEKTENIMYLPETLGNSCYSDQVMTVVLEHRPGRESVWLSDLFRTDRYAPVLGRVFSFEEYFKNLGRSGPKKSYEKDDFRTNYLTRAAKSGKEDPVSEWNSRLKLEEREQREKGQALLNAWTEKRNKFKKGNDAALVQRDSFSSDKTNDVQNLGMFPKNFPCEGESGTIVENPTLFPQIFVVKPASMLGRNGANLSMNDGVALNIDTVLSNDGADFSKDTALLSINADLAKDNAGRVDVSAEAGQALHEALRQIKTKSVRSFLKVREEKTPQQGKTKRLSATRPELQTSESLNEPLLIQGGANAPFFQAILPPLSRVWIPGQYEEASLDSSRFFIEAEKSKCPDNRSAETTQNESKENLVEKNVALKGLFRRVAKNVPWRRKSDSEKSPCKTPKMVDFFEEQYSKTEIAQAYRLRNDFFEIRVDPVTGAFQRLDTYQSSLPDTPTKSSAEEETRGDLFSKGLLRQPGRGNRFAFQLGLRLPEALRRTDGRSTDDANFGYSLMSADQFEILSHGPLVGTLQVRGRLMTPQGELAAHFLQTLSVTRGSRVIEAEVEFAPVLLPSEHAWNNYYGCLFAWKDSYADLRVGCQKAFWLTQRDYLQATECVDIRSEERLGVTILSGGLPFYRRYGMHRLDSVLLPAGESRRRFRFGIGVDLENPMQEALKFSTVSAHSFSFSSESSGKLNRFKKQESTSLDAGGQAETCNDASSKFFADAGASLFHSGGIVVRPGMSKPKRLFEQLVHVSSKTGTVLPVEVEPIFQASKSRANVFGQTDPKGARGTNPLREPSRLVGFKLALQETDGKDTEVVLETSLPMERIESKNFLEEKMDEISLQNHQRASLAIRRYQLLLLEIILK